jgi:hypothetical protein
MKAYGKAKKKRHNHIDNHPQKGYQNWWEEEIEPCKATARQEDQKEIKEQVEEDEPKIRPIYIDDIGRSFKRINGKFIKTNRGERQ